MVLRRDLHCSLNDVSIQKWRQCLASQPGVVEVQPVVALATGVSRKSKVPPEVAAAGGGHLCPYELYVQINGLDKKHRATSGLTKHGGQLHVYFRELPGKVPGNVAKEILCAAATMLAAGAPLPLPMPLGHAPPPPPPPPPTPLPAAVPPPPAEDFVATLPFNGSTYGAEYLNLEPDEIIRMLPPPEQAFGWSYGELKASGRRGWFPPKFVEPDNAEWF